jgi:hypothetical protein
MTEAHGGRRCIAGRHDLDADGALFLEAAVQTAAVLTRFAREPGCVMLGGGDLRDVDEGGIVFGDHAATARLEERCDGGITAHAAKIDYVGGDMREDAVEGDGDLDGRGALGVEEDVAVLGGGLAHPYQAVDAVAAVNGEWADQADGVALADHGDREAGRGVGGIQGECGAPLGQPGVGLEGEVMPAACLLVQTVPFRFQGLEAGAVFHDLDRNGSRGGDLVGCFDGGDVQPGGIARTR